MDSRTPGLDAANEYPKDLGEKPPVDVTVVAESLFHLDPPTAANAIKAMLDDELLTPAQAESVALVYDMEPR